MVRLVKNHLPQPVKNLLFLLRYYFYLFFCRHQLFGEKDYKSCQVLSDNGNSTFFGYHDKTPFSADGSKILAMSVAASDIKSDSECTQMKLGYFVKGKSSFHKDFIPFAKTTTWCWQQGCMLQWNPLNADSQVYYNAMVNNSYGSILYDLNEKKTIKEYSYPIYSLDPTGRYAISLNFSRLGRLRPGYGYSLLKDDTAGEVAPKNDGLFLLDLETGSRRLLVSLEELASTTHISNHDSVRHYVNHATFSPSGKSIVFFHLWACKDYQGRGLKVCAYDIKDESWRVVEDNRIVSHYCWKNESEFLATTREKNGCWHYSIYNLSYKKRLDLNLPFDRDGHPMFHPSDTNLIVTDTYPDKRRDQHLCVVSIKDRLSNEIATLHSPFSYQGQVRCDLHPRWDREGKFVVVDSPIKKRCLCLFEI